jgi:ketosteroid isomerase-like protein
LYSQDVVSIEAMSGPSMPAQLNGLAAVQEKSAWWAANHEVHGSEIAGPWPHGDRFIVRFTLDVTSKAGPMAGKRMKLDEAALYTVKDGKVIKEEFFYDMGA